MLREENMKADFLIKFVIASKWYLTQLMPLKEINCPMVEEKEAFLIEMKKT